ncbi:MAG: hypothetical protein Q9186_004916 [Xanthomendoza sp. 1 TL-2023]
MAPQTSIPISATILGTIGTILWCIQLIPQAIKNHRTKTTEGLPASMMFFWAVCAVPFGVYAVVQRFNIREFEGFFFMWLGGQGEGGEGRGRGRRERMEKNFGALVWGSGLVSWE